MARSNLTALIPVVYEALDVVGQELIGFTNAVTIYGGEQRAALGQPIRSPVTSSLAPVDIVPGPYPPEGEHSIGHRDLTIQKARAVPITITGEDELSLGDNWMVAYRDELAQAMRSIVNEVDSDIGALYAKASRAHGVAGTTPFVKGGNELKDSSFLEDILDANGAPRDRALVIDSAAKTNLAGLTVLTHVSYAGDMGDFRRLGEISDQFGFSVRKSAHVVQHVAGSGSGYQTDNAAGYSKGDTALHLDTGTGEIKAGDVITIADDASGSQYVVTTGATGPGDVDIEIGAPGLMSGVADNKAVTIAANYRANMGFSRSGIVLAARPPAINMDGDMAVDSQIVLHEPSGIAFEVRSYVQYRRVTYDVGLVWGVSANPNHLALLLG